MNRPAAVAKQLDAALEGLRAAQTLVQTEDVTHATPAALLERQEMLEDLGRVLTLTDCMRGYLRTKWGA